MKKYRLILLLLMLFAAGASSFAHNILVVAMRDGSSAKFMLESKPKITFVGDVMKIVSSGSSMEFIRSDVKNYHFDSEGTAVNETVAESNVSFEGNVLVVSGVAENMPVTVYSSAGVVVKQTVVIDGSCSISLDDLATGLYIVTFNNMTFKFLKR